MRARRSSTRADVVRRRGRRAVPRLRAAVEVGPTPRCSPYEHIAARRSTGSTGRSPTPTSTPCSAPCARCDERIVHRASTPDQLIRGTDGRVWLAGVQHGTIAASDVRERIDLAELLCTAALLTDAARGRDRRRVFGADRLVRACRAAAHRALARDPCSDAQTEGRPRACATSSSPSAADTEQLERCAGWKPRTLSSIVAGAIAAYVLLAAGQPGPHRHAAQGRLALGARRRPRGASRSSVHRCRCRASCPKLSHVRTFAAQLRGGLRHPRVAADRGRGGGQRALPAEVGLHRRSPPASVGVSQVFAFFIHIGLLAITAVLAGRTSTSTCRRRAVIIGAVVVVALGAAAVRTGASDPEGCADLGEVGPRLLTVAQPRGRSPGHRRHPRPQRRLRAVHDRLLRAFGAGGDLRGHRAGLPRRLHPRPGGADPRRPRRRRGGVRRKIAGIDGASPVSASCRLLTAPRCRATGASTGSSGSARCSARPAHASRAPDPRRRTARGCLPVAEGLVRRCPRRQKYCRRLSRSTDAVGATTDISPRTSGGPRACTVMVVRSTSTAATAAGSAACSPSQV